MTEPKPTVVTQDSPLLDRLIAAAQGNLHVTVPVADGTGGRFAPADHGRD